MVETRRCRPSLPSLRFPGIVRTLSCVRTSAIRSPDSCAMLHITNTMDSIIIEDQDLDAVADQGGKFSGGELDVPPDADDELRAKEAY